MTQALLVNGIWMLCYLVYIWTNTLLWGRISKSGSWTERQCFLKQLLSAASWYSHYQFKLLLSKLRESSIYHWVNTQGERGGNTERKRLRTSLERERTCVYFSTRGSEKNPTAQHSKNPNPCFCFWEYMGKCMCVCVCVLFSHNLWKCTTASLFHEINQYGLKAQLLTVHLNPWGYE